ncbi:MAG: hypothetical protein JWM36_72 [Hyphomicrobiales bacterium]|nr:hypothetical protein [Hyphomicrobiales bacterium]MDB5593111.1 hypothetical protein [Hyphomicrobiales bacterium]
MFPSRLLAALSLAAALALPGGAARAHPHVFVAVKSVLLFGPDGKISGVRHAWTFDDMYSAFATQGMGGKAGKPSESELKELAKVNVEQLEEAEFFTVLRAGGKKAEFAPATDYTITLDAKKLITLHFTAPLKEPASAGKAAVLQVFDPSYFVAFDFEKQTPVTLGAAPQGCTVSVSTPPPLAPTDAQKLNDSAGTMVSPGADFGIKLASRAIVACP